MSSNNTENEIDVLDIGKGIQNLLFTISKAIITIVLFFKKKAIIIIGILLIGGAIGYTLDTYFPKYKSQVIVASNFESIDYLYNSIELIDSKIKEKDVDFLKKIGISNVDEVVKISIRPVVDVYDFISKNPQNFEMIKLLSEGVDTKKTITDLVTSKNYSAHEVYLVTNNKDVSEAIIQSLLTYLNNNKFHEDLRKTTIKNIEYQLSSNQQMIDQIDDILKGFSKEKENKTSSEKLVYYNDNMDLNDIINTRNNLVIEQGVLRVKKQYFNKFIKEKSTTLNIKENKSISSKLRIVLPFIGIMLFLGMSLIIALSKKAK